MTVRLALIASLLLVVASAPAEAAPRRHDAAAATAPGQPGWGAAIVPFAPVLLTLGATSLVYMAFHTDAASTQALFWPVVTTTTIVGVVGVPLGYGLGFGLAGNAEAGGHAYLNTRPLALGAAAIGGLYGGLVINNDIQARLILGLIGLEAGAGVGEILGAGWSAYDAARIGNP